MTSPALPQLFQQNAQELTDLLGRLEPLHQPLTRLGEALMRCWNSRGKVLVAGNGGSAADAMHFAEELVVRFQRNRKALAAIALTDPTVITCAANDLSFEQIFERQVQALGNPGDLLLILSTSGNSPNVVRAVQAAKAQSLTTAAFLGKGGGVLKGVCDLELLVPSSSTARIQEVHKLFFHTLCQWIDSQVE